MAPRWAILRTDSLRAGDLSRQPHTPSCSAKTPGAQVRNLIPVLRQNSGPRKAEAPALEGLNEPWEVPGGTWLHVHEHDHR
jgi:hypothetical protein